MSELKFHDLTFHRRGEDWVVAYEPTGAYALIDDTGKQLIHHLEEHGIASAKENYPEYDVDDFLQTLKNNGLIYTQDHRVVDHRKKITDVLDLEKDQLRWAKHPVTIGVLAGLALTAFYLALTQPTLVPTPEWFYASGWYAALLPTIVIMLFAISFLHEFAHYAALKASGHTTGLHLQHRWHFIRARTNIDNAQLLRTPAKIGVYSAGILTDLALLTISILIVAYTNSPFAKLFALLAFLHALGQFTPAKEADLMRIASHHAGVQDITEHFTKALKNMCIFCDNDEDYHPRAVPLLILSTAVLAILLGIYILPFIGTVALSSTKTILTAATAKDAALFTDSLLALLMLSITAAFSATAQLRDHKHSDEAWFRSLMTALFSLSTFTAVALIASGFMAYASIPTNMIANLLLGLIYGALLIRHTSHFKTSEYHVPTLTALTAILLIALLSAVAAGTGVGGPVAVYAVMYTLGMLASTLI